jgi:hypothetical protein
MSRVPETTLQQFLCDAEDEANRAIVGHGQYHSVHEAYAILMEEVDEFWTQVKKKRKNRDPKNIYHELMQVAAVAAKAALKFGVRPTPKKSKKKRK